MGPSEPTRLPLLRQANPNPNPNSNPNPNPNPSPNPSPNPNPNLNPNPHPFSGNAFFRECGDAFSSISLDNPDATSEHALLSHVAPAYDAATHGRVLASLTAAFAELRQLAESGSIAHPYSMREAVATARHLEKYPNDSVPDALANATPTPTPTPNPTPNQVPDALANAVAFEAFDAPLRELLASVFEKHGVTGTAAR